MSIRNEMDAAGDILKTSALTVRHVLRKGKTSELTAAILDEGVKLTEAAEMSTSAPNAAKMMLQEIAEKLMDLSK